MYSDITRCRMTGSTALEPILSLGDLAMTGIFPPKETPVARAPIDLVLCSEGGLVQLRQTYDPKAMYGANYGYRSGLNRAMVRHLQDKALRLERMAKVQRGEVVLDIGSNDGTLLRHYTDIGQARGGIDPTADKFMEFYPPNTLVAPKFFSQAVYRDLFGGRQAKLVTSIAMFYDLPDPVAFALDVAAILHKDGIWHLEQSYLPTMLDQCAYDTICHEHLEYYGLRQIAWIMQQAGLHILDVELNSVNGGSFAVTVGKGAYVPQPSVAALLQQEEARELDRVDSFVPFLQRVRKHQWELPQLIRSLRDSGKKVFGYGASTKGNVLLQTCGLTVEDIPCIADVNPDKYGCVTPGTNIPIVSEADAKRMQPDYFLVLPWHFRAGLITREEEFLMAGGQLIFPLPEITVVGHGDT